MQRDSKNRGWFRKVSETMELATNGKQRVLGWFLADMLLSQLEQEKVTWNHLSTFARHV